MGTGRNVRPLFEAERIWSDVDESKSMFLQVPHKFAHVVLKDASKYDVAMNAMRRIETQQTMQNERFEWRLRSIWKIESAEYRGVYYNEDGALCAASEIYVVLSSGSRNVSLRVPFSHQAGEDLARATGTSPKDYEILNRLKTQKTRRYIELLLAAGGEMAWDPLWPGGDQLRIESTALLGFFRRRNGRHSNSPHRPVRSS